MGKCYDIPEILITVEGGVVQNVDIPKGTNAKVRVIDFDCQETPETDDRVQTNDQGDNYFESIYESEE